MSKSSCPECGNVMLTFKFDFRTIEEKMLYSFWREQIFTRQGYSNQISEFFPKLGGEENRKHQVNTKELGKMRSRQSMVIPEFKISMRDEDIKEDRHGLWT